MKHLIIALIVILAFPACALFDKSLSPEDRISSSEQQLVTTEKVVAELERTGDLSSADVAVVNDAIGKVREVLSTAGQLAINGFPQDASAQYEIAIDAIHIAQDKVKNDKLKQNLGRLAAALVIAQSFLPQ